MWWWHAGLLPLMALLWRKRQLRWIIQLGTVGANGRELFQECRPKPLIEDNSCLRVSKRSICGCNSAVYTTLTRVG